jgi:hypothetical protein
VAHRLMGNYCSRFQRPLPETMADRTGPNADLQEFRKQTLNATLQAPLIAGAT